MSTYKPVGLANTRTSTDYAQKSLRSLRRRTKLNEKVVGPSLVQQIPPEKPEIYGRYRVNIFFRAGTRAVNAPIVKLQ